MRHSLLLCVALVAPLAAQQFVAELDPNAAASFAPDPRDALADNGVAYFTADAPGFGRELHVTDGTVAGTRVFADMLPGPQGSGARALGVIGSSVVVQLGTHLRITDGTNAGTRTFATGVDTIDVVRWLGVTGSRFVLAVKPYGGFGFQLMVSDGTTAGTTTIGSCIDVAGAIARNGRLTILCTTTGAQLISTDGVTTTPVATLPGLPRSGFAALAAHDCFLVDDPVGNTELWRTDGTTAGTTFVAGLGPTQLASSIAELGANVVVGAANQLWISDGTGAGTTPVSAPLSHVRSLTRAGSVLCFTSGISSTGGPQLWRTDGTAVGTFALDTTPTVYTQFAVGTTRTYCYALSSAGIRLLRTDGTPAGTTSVPVVDVGAYRSLAAFGDDAIVTTAFGAPSAHTGLHAFRTDATPGGNLRLTASTAPAGVLGAERGAAIESTLFFPAATAATGYELWRTDGSSAGTQLVQDFVPGPTGGVNGVAALRGSVWVASGNAIWRIDSPTSAPVLALQPDPIAIQANSVVAADGWLLFRTTGSTGTKLWRSDGTAAGTVLLYSISPLVQAFGPVVQMGDVTYWVVNEFLSTRLFRSDGTVAGLADLGATGFWLAPFGDRLLFARVVSGTIELRAVVANAMTSQLVAVVPFAPVGSGSTGTHLVCFSNAGTSFATDGVSTVTSLPLPTVTPPYFGADGFVYAASFSPTVGTSFWRTDGTVAGTGPAFTFGPLGLGDVLAAEPLGSGNRLFLDAGDGVSGSEPWISQGTQATTTLLADLVPNGNSSPQLLGIAGERAYFVAFDPVRGRELWSFDLATVGAANAQPFGVGCPGTNGIPRIAVDGMPAIGRTLSLRISRGAPSSIGLWFVGLDPQHLSVGGGCEFLMTTIAWSDWAFTNAAGAATTSLFVPNDPVFVGLPVVAQGSFLDPLGVSSFGTTVTEGVLLVLGG